jgi:hypothetical protein
MPEEEIELERWARRRARRDRLTSVAGFVLGVVLVAAAFGLGHWSAGTPGGSGSGGSGAGPGPSRAENGVPVGYAHTRQGAVAAATTFVTVVDGPMVFQPDRYHQAVGTLALPSARAEIESDAERMMDTMPGAGDVMASAQQGRAVVCRTVPLAYRLDAYDDRQARVSIWAESLLAADGAVAPRQSWATVTVTITWRDRDWKLADIGAYAGGSDGPVPAVTQAPAQSSTLPPQLRDFQEYRQDAG